RNLGPGGAELAILGSAISQDSLFLASPEGILRGALNDNLQDFNNWFFFPAESGVPDNSIQAVVRRNNQVYALFNNTQLFQYQHLGQWTSVSLPNLSRINLLRTSGSQLLLANDRQLIRLGENNQIDIIEDPLFRQIQDVGRDSQGNFWLSDRINGLLGNPSGTYQSFFPNGPARAEVVRVQASQGQIFALSGGADANQNPQGRDAGYYVFDGRRWQNFNAFDPIHSTDIPDLLDLNDFVFDSRRGLNYFASFQNGLFSQDREGNTSLINENTSGTTLRLDNNLELKISALALDFEGRLWMANPGGENTLHVLSTDDSWQAFPPFVNQASNPLDILVDNFSDFKWIRLDPNLGGGIWVLDDRNSLQRFLSSSTNNGSLPSSRVNALAQDREGQIWVGTDQGVAVFLDPFSIFQGNVNAITPIFELRPLLRAEKVSSIAIDGGNRKWFGTESGVWLFNADTDALIHHFTESNSPLLSDIILDLTIDPRSGELFIATDRGLVSYRGTATEGTANFQNVQIFPNPVLPNFEGQVGISGLVEGARVKITDVSGRLIFEDDAEGGTVTWNLRDYTGFRARTGVYLVFSTNQDGSESFIGKIAVIE
ncbi:MAG: two-component regulator propeller domain-containing protein, partial [Bacteroidota bacterium]